MSLDGLRAWVAEVERKLGMRTRVFLVLSVLAIGGAGAAIYLAIDTRDSAVSESDVQELQRELEAQIGTGAGGTGLAQLEAELKTLQAQVEQLNGKGDGPGQGNDKGASGSDGTGDSGSRSGSSGDGATGGASTGGGNIDSEKLRELVEQTEEKNKAAEEAE